MRRLWLGALGLTALLSGCPESCLIQRTRPRSSGNAAPVEMLRPAAPPAPVVSPTAPVPQHPGKGVFDQEIEYLGYDTDPLQPRGGMPVAITYYFHVLKDVSQNWQIFVHVDDRGGTAPRINADHWPAGGNLPTDHWKAGQYIADRFVVDIPQAQSKGQVELWSGFYQDDIRLPISNPKECPNDGNNRLLAGTLHIE